MAENQASFTLTKMERRAFKQLAKNAGLSFSNYVRWRLGLEVLKHGDINRINRMRKKEQPTEEK